MTMAHDNLFLIKSLLQILDLLITITVTDSRVFISTSLTVQQGQKTTALHMQHNIDSFTFNAPFYNILELLT